MLSCLFSHATTGSLRICSMNKVLFYSVPTMWSRVRSTKICDWKSCLVFIYQSGRFKRKSAFEHAQHAQIQIGRACANYHTDHCSPFITFTFCIVSNDSVSSSEGPDQTARMRRLIWAFAVRICPKTRFCRVRVIYQASFVLSRVI